MAVDVGLVLLGPAVGDGAVVAGLGLGAEFAHDDGFLGEVPGDGVGQGRLTLIPADVLVDADDVENLGERIRECHGGAFEVGGVEGGSDGPGRVEGVGLLDEAGEEGGAGGVVGGLVGDGPEEDGGFVAVAADHLMEHEVGFGVDRGVVEGDVLPEGNLGPDHDALAVGGAEHALVVGVVGEADEVGMELTDPGEERIEVLVRVGATAAVGGFALNADAAQEDRLAVEQDVGAFDADIAEADVVVEGILAGDDFEFVELGGFGRPEAEGTRGEIEGGAAGGVRGDGGGEMGFGNFDGDGKARRCTFDVDVAGDFVGGAGDEVGVIVVDKMGGDLDEGDIAREAAVVVPVVVEGGDAVDEAGGVDGDDDEVAAGVEDLGGFAIEGGEAALVVAQALAVHPDVRTVVGGPYVEEGAGAGLGVEVEVALVPDNAFVAEEGGVLGVPVAGDVEGWGGGEIVLSGLGGAGNVELLVEGVGVVFDLALGGVKIGAGHVDEVVPRAVEADGGAVINVDEESVEWFLRGRGRDGGQKERR